MGKVWKALGLHFAAVGGLILARTWVDVIFLSTYPASWLPFFYAGTTAVMVALSLSLTPLIARGSRAINAAILVCGVALAAVARPFMEVPGVPFALSLWLSALATLLGVISWNSVGDAFDVRDFKRWVKWITAAGTLGATVFGASVPLLLGLGETALIVVLACLCAVTAALVLALGSGEVDERPAKGSARGSSPLRYPLFRALAVGVFFLMMVDTLADYALKSELAGTCSKEEIGRLMGPFYAVCSVLSLGLQLALSSRLLSRFGIGGLLTTVPVVCVAGNLALALRPSLWTGGALRMLENITYYSFYNVGREVGSGPLPSAARRTGKLYLKSVVSPIGTGAAALLIWGFAEAIQLRGLAVVGLVLCLAWLIAIRRVVHAYRETLEEAVRTRRFGGAGDLSVLDAQAVAPLARYALASDDAERIRFGLRLLEATRSPLPSAALAHLTSRVASVRVAVADAARASGDAEPTSALLAQLESERDPSATWALFHALTVLDPTSALPAARSRMSSPLPEARGGAVLVSLNSGRLDEIIDGAIALRGLTSHEDPTLRRMAARILGAYAGDGLERELGRLLEDADEDVMLEAIVAAGRRRATDLIEPLVELLGSGRTGHCASAALVQLGEAAVAPLARAARRRGVGPARGALRTLARIDHEAVEAAFVDLARATPIATRTTLARLAAQRARRRGAPPALRAAASELVKDEARTIRVLASSARADALPRDVARELRERQRLADERLVHWLAVCTAPARVLDVVPALRGDRAQRATAIELLDALVPSELRRSVAALEADGTTYDEQEAMARLMELDDPWLWPWIARTRTAGGDMNQAERTMLLRRVDLFAQLPGEVLMALAEQWTPREVKRGDAIFSKGDASDALFVVAVGSVEILRGERVLATLGPADTFGEIGLLDSSPRLANAVATCDGLVLHMKAATFEQVTDDLPEVLRSIVKKLLGYLREGQKPGTLSGPLRVEDIKAAAAKARQQDG